MTAEGNACRLMIDEAMTRYKLPTSESAARLLCMIAGHESGGFCYVHQLGGPALGLFQMEPLTFQDVSEYCARKDYLDGELPSIPSRLIFDAHFAAAMARVFFLRIPEPLPDPDHITALANYAKRYWNTWQGKATPDDYANAWRTHFED